MLLHGVVKVGGCVSFLHTLRDMNLSGRPMSLTFAVMHLLPATTLTTLSFVSFTLLSATNAAGWEPKVGLTGPNIPARSGTKSDIPRFSNTAKSSFSTETRRSVKSLMTAPLGCWRPRALLGDGPGEFCGVGIGTVLVLLGSCAGLKKSFVSLSKLVGQGDLDWLTLSAGLAPIGNKLVFQDWNRNTAFLNSIFIYDSFSSFF